MAQAQELRAGLVFVNSAGHNLIVFQICCTGYDWFVRDAVFVDDGLLFLGGQECVNGQNHQVVHSIVLQPGVFIGEGRDQFGLKSIDFDIAVV